MRNPASLFRQRCQPRTRCELESEKSALEPTENLGPEYLSLVKVIAWQIYSGLPRHAFVELSDIVQAGHLGLVNATRTYSAGFQVPFASYARHRIRGEILDSLRKLDTASRNLRWWQRRIENSAHDLSLNLNRDPTDEEVSARLGVGVARLRKKRLALWHAGPCAMPQTSDGETERCSRSLASAPDGMPDFIQERREMKEFLERAVSTLPPRSRKVIECYYLRSMPMKQIGRLLNVNESRVSQIHKTALQLMARGLRASGIRSAADI
ncbi:MAG: polymerase, sigma 28 subunit, FliA/WhiG family [Bryobacterales bacterium]|nr:polymerase, sigma 28 subunit, FliA/WhiG family [Bryobacterales bacterium]